MTIFSCFVTQHLYLRSLGCHSDAPIPRSTGQSLSQNPENVRGWRNEVWPCALRLPTLTLNQDRLERPFADDVR